MKIILLYFLTVSVAFAQFSAEVFGVESARDPVQFTHIPFILLRFNPSDALGYNNTFQYGVELAPPFGKLSFAFDYGMGKGKYNINKQVKFFQPQNKNREFRGEIKAYFSDWYPFYALDKKPFGRYYSLEYINGLYLRELGIPVGDMLEGAGHYLGYLLKNTSEQTHVIHIKLGNHIHLHKHLFLDVFAGLGAGMGKFVVDDEEDPVGINGRLYNPAKLNFLSDKSYVSPKGNRFFFSKTFGVRIAVPL